MTTSAGVAIAPYEELAATLRGVLIMPGDGGYDETRARGRRRALAGAVRQA
jgi:hypothetical protein